MPESSTYGVAVSWGSLRIKQAAAQALALARQVRVDPVEQLVRLRLPLYSVSPKFSCIEVVQWAR